MINAGANILAQRGKGWTNTYKTAVKRAETWLKQMHKEGMVDVFIVPGPPRENAGRWLFSFRHPVTGITCILSMHGIDNLTAYEREFIFAPRTYWNGCSSAEPELEDFQAVGFEPVQTWRARGGSQ